MSGSLDRQLAVLTGPPAALPRRCGGSRRPRYRAIETSLWAGGSVRVPVDKLREWIERKAAERAEGTR